jgi:hypothetical protein
MTSGTPYNVPMSFTDDESVYFVSQWEYIDGTPYHLDEVKIEWSVRDANDCPVLLLSEGKGITKGSNTIDGATIIFDAGVTRLSPGRYAHGCRITQISTGRSQQIWDGSIIIGEGQF